MALRANRNQADAPGQPDPKPDPQTEPQTDPKPEPQTDPKPEAEDKAKANGNADIDLDFLTTGARMLASELAAETQPVRQRNERQAVMDAKVKELHDAWLKAGKPGDWNSLAKAGVVATYFIEPDKTSKLKTYVNRAAQFHDVRARWGSSFLVTAQHIARFNLPPEYEGREAITFAIMSKRPRPAKDDKPADVKPEPATTSA